jgi:hypothetical protein
MVGAMELAVAIAGTTIQMQLVLLNQDAIG